MATRDEELRVRATFDGSELKAGLDGVASTGAAAGAAVGAAGEKAADGLDKAADAARRTGEAVEGAGKKGSDGLDLTSAAARDLEAYLKRLEVAGVAPETVTRNAEKAAAALALVTAEAQKAGTEIPPQFAGAGAAIEAAKDRAVAMGAALKDVGQTPTKFDNLVKGVTELVQTEAKAITETQALQAQIAKLNATNSPRGLMLGIAQLQARLEEVAAKAKLAGQAVGPEMAAEVRRAEAAIAQAIPRAGKLADTIADTRKQAGIAVEGYKTLGAAGGGLQGVFSVMDDAGKGLTSTLGKIGIGAIGLTQALKLGYETGQTIRTLYQDLTGKELPNLTNAFLKLTMGVDDSTKAFDRHGVTARSHAGLTNAAKQAVAGLFDQLQKLNPALKSADDEYGRGAKELDLLTQAMFKAASGGPGSIRAFEEELKRAATVLAADFTKGLRDGTIDTTKLTVEQKKLIEEVKRLAAAATDSAAKLGAAFAQIRDEYAKDAAAAEANRDKIIAASKTKLREIDADLQAGRISLEQHSEAKRQIIEQERTDEVAALEAVDAAKAKAVTATEKLANAEGVTAKQLVEATTKHDAYGTSVGASAAKSEEFARALESVDRSSSAYTAKLADMRKAHGEAATSFSSFNEKLAAGETHLKLATENTGKLGESISITAGKAAASVGQLDAMAQAFDRVAAAAARAAGAGAGGGA